MSKDGDPTNWGAGRPRCAAAASAVPLAASSCGGEGTSTRRAARFLRRPAGGGGRRLFPPQDDDAPTGDSSGGHASMADTRPESRAGRVLRADDLRQGAGRRPGRHAVTISWTRPSPAGDGEDEQILPAEYLDPAASGLTAKVKEGETKYPPGSYAMRGKRGAEGFENRALIVRCSVEILGRAGKEHKVVRQHPQEDLFLLAGPPAGACVPTRVAASAARSRSRSASAGRTPAGNGSAAAAGGSVSSIWRRYFVLGLTPAGVADGSRGNTVERILGRSRP